jgi:glycosyltransferase involved in cell wall biosynthesis
VLPSYSENFAVAVVEAMAAGLPVVVSDQVGIHRDITKARAGLVVPCNGPALSRALAALMASDSLRAEMGRNAARLARTAFSTEAATENLIALYRRICQQDFNHRNAASIQRDRSLSAVS